jgi:hypothetical protein
VNGTISDLVVRLSSRQFWPVQKEKGLKICSVFAKKKEPKTYPEQQLLLLPHPWMLP